MVNFTAWRKKPTSTEGRSATGTEKTAHEPRKWRLGILDDPYTDEVPGSVILLSKAHQRNEPLGLQHAQARTSASSLPRQSSRSRPPEKKRTKDGRFILEPQPEESANDPLNWRQLRRDTSLISLGFYCMIGGGMTPILAAGFNDVAETYNVSYSQVTLTTGLYMLGLGLGNVVVSPTAILYGKRPVYLGAIIIFCLSSIWCALSPNYASLVVARIVQGFAVSPVECLPSASIAEIYFLHERAYRLGIYTLLLLGGKNLMPLVSAAIVQSLGWRWVFWIIAIVVFCCFFLIFFFVPETFWDRTPTARSRSHHSRSRNHSPDKHGKHFRLPSEQRDAVSSAGDLHDTHQSALPLEHSKHVGFADDVAQLTPAPINDSVLPTVSPRDGNLPHASGSLHSDPEKQDNTSDSRSLSTATPGRATDTDQVSEQFSIHYTDYYRSAPLKSYRQSLKPWNGRLVKDKWIRVMARPFILFAYPAVLWSSLVYALAVGWLIILSESVAHIYKGADNYNFNALQVGLVYISPFVGGILGTAVAGKISDIVVRFMARKNDGVYEPEFRLIMALPITLSTVIGLMGFGWAAEEKDNWIVPTVFFGVISFGCSLASTTAVTFVVDSYRVYAGESLVTLNFCKNILHGFIFSLFFPSWLEHSGSKDTFLVIGGIQLGCMMFSIPMYIYGKRARMWTVRKKLMEKF
ncbi:MFS general substrate transporter [Dothidotthia symphoricarpi CBS 119687]|uniref:MFS general substrate transporter n=1 Tax=Dothidotthia symphoricarpi CBS 119687 TaxID=1392245 RepID=A0A6A6AKQ8_9PLEO|nr:MFS general substrate transporter [Dothidotthia symphoricarpi CBS 119687]KAF2132146.1 MFS general substrate transporter [Dothidotthia symphoricarpi CBS 119687]